MAIEVTLRKIIQELLEKSKNKKDPKEEGFVISWSWGDPVTTCSVPRELAVEYASILKRMGFQPGKSRYDHCWIKPSSDRFRWTEESMRAFARELEKAGAKVKIEYQDKELSMIPEGRTLESVFGLDS